MNVDAETAYAFIQRERQRPDARFVCPSGCVAVQLWWVDGRTLVVKAGGRRYQPAQGEVLAYGPEGEAELIDLPRIRARWGSTAEWWEPDKHGATLGATCRHHRMLAAPDGYAAAREGHRNGTPVHIVMGTPA